MRHPQYVAYQFDYYHFFAFGLLKNKETEPHGSKTDELTDPHDHGSKSFQIPMFFHSRCFRTDYTENSRYNHIKNKELCLKNKLKAGYHSYFRYQSVYEIRKTSDIALNINAKKQEISQRRAKSAVN